MVPAMPATEGACVADTPSHPVCETVEFELPANAPISVVFRATQ
jgi:hypothetical protein